MELKNLKNFEDYLAENVDDIEINEDSAVFESDENDVEIYFNGELFEAAAPKLTAKEKKKAQEIGQLMKAVNKSDAYKSAKEKFIKTFKKEAKATVKELGLSPKVLKKLDKITVKDI